MSTSMLARTSGVWKVARSTASRPLWRQPLSRCYAVDSSSEPEWFQLLRAEMLGREVTYLHEDIITEPENRLANTLSGFLPQSWCRPPTVNRPVVPPGHHLIWFNPALPTDKLLPDGTDASQSPGDPWVRRMWAGGSIMLRPDQYYHTEGGFVVDTAMAGAERIKDVRLRGQGDAAKLFVTIERRFARVDHLHISQRRARQRTSSETPRASVVDYFKQQLRDDMEWGDAMLKEERELVFFKERSAAELEAIKAGHMAPVKYLDRPVEPEMSLALTPTPSLLFRFSALTFNAHLIHLDREYARSVEGHRNLLVHGPLSLTLMLQAISNHLRTANQKRELVERIDYRNLAPLYCDEEMRICATKKTTTEKGSTYDIWIEGPTGGVAVKGTVRTVKWSETIPNINKKKISRRGKDLVFKHIIMSREEETSTSVRSTPPGKVITTSEIQSSNVLPTSGDASFAAMHKLTAKGIMTAHDSETESSISNSLPVSEATAADHASSSVRSHVQAEQLDVQDPRSFVHSDQYNKRTRMRSYQFVDRILPLRPMKSHRPLQPNMSPTSRYILRRLTKRRPEKTYVKPVPLVRTYDASPYDAEKHSRFRKVGIRKIEKARVRTVVLPYPPRYRKR